MTTQPSTGSGLDLAQPANLPYPKTDANSQQAHKHAKQRR